MVAAGVLQNSSAGDLFHVLCWLIFATGLIKKKYRLGAVLLFESACVVAALMVLN